MHRKRRIAALLLPFCATLGIGGCQDYVFEPVLSGFISSRSIEVDIPIVSQFDILFVVDDSGSMAGNQENLANNLDTFIRLLEERNQERIDEGKEILDFQIGVASTSILQRIDSYGDLQHTEHYGKGSDNSDCLDGTAYDFPSGTPFPAGQLMAAGDNDRILTTQHFLDDPDDALRQFRENIRLGTCGSSQEEGFEAMRRVLLENPGFFRDRSRLVVVFLSDEEDSSDRTGNFISYILRHDVPYSQGYIDARLHPEYRPELTPVSYYKSFLDDLAEERGGSVAIASVVSAIEGEDGPPHDMVAEVHPDEEDYQEWNCFDSECAWAACPECDQSNLREETSGPPHWCGGHTPGSRYLELARMFPRTDQAQLMDSICQTDFSSTLEDLVDIVDPDQCFVLESHPHNHDTNLVLVRIEREGEPRPIVCTPPEEHGEQACDDGADWWYDPEGTHGPEICICDDSECLLEPGDSYRLSVIERACSPDNPC